MLMAFSDKNYKSNYTMAKVTKTCLLCGGPAFKFRNPSARLEYTISALCQVCQDEGMHDEEAPLHH